MASGWPAAQRRLVPTQQQQQLYAGQAGPSQQYGNPYSYAGPSNQARQPPQPPPPPAPAALTGDGRLRSVDELPACFRTVFPFRYFNAIQNDCWPVIFEGQGNVIIAAPTGGGKTVLLELAVLRMLAQHVNAAGQFCPKAGHLKAVYLAPARALVQEKVRDWTARFAALGITCRELTGDTDREGMEGLDSADIICATPEKFDAVTRSGMRFFADIGLVLIDEVHLLNENRGSSLEGIVARIKMVSRLREMREQPIGAVRYVAVSATIPNVQDLAEWLAVPHGGIKCFGEEMRPVKLCCIVRGYNPTKTDFLFERRLNDYIFQTVAEFSAGKPSLVFCSSRKGTSETAVHLAKEAAKQAESSGGFGGRGGNGYRPSAFVRDTAQQQRLVQAAAGLKNAQLRECVQMGIGYHHAAMEPEERAAVESLFLAQDLPVLCTTSTLAMGVNLPARLVVLKGTRRYIGSEAEDPSGYQEYERSTCLQMVGRAGRPQFDTEGIAVIMTQKPHVQRYEQLTSGSELVESTLKEVLPEFLNAEITLRTVNDVSQAIDWLRATYFYVRARRSPAQYGLPRQLLGQPPEALDRWLKDKLVLATVRELAEHGMVRLHDDAFGLEPLQPGQIMAEKYVRMKTMVSLCGAPQGAAIPDLITILAKSAELSNIKLRRNEKKVLNEINHSGRVRFPVMNPAKPGKVLERISSNADKIFILVNEGLSDSPTEKLEYSLRQDMDQVLSVGRRISGAMIKYFEHLGRASETFNALLLSKSLRQKMWTESQLETRQLPGIGPLIAQRLAAAGVHTLRQLAEVEPRRLESLAQRNYPFGNEVQASLAQCLPPAISLQCLPLAWLPGGLLELEVTVERTSSSEASSPARLLVGSLHDDALLLCRPLALEQFPSPLVLRTRTRMPVKGVGASVQVVASVVHERLVGVDVAVKTVVPAGVKLQGQADASSLPAEPSGVHNVPSASDRAGAAAAHATSRPSRPALQQLQQGGSAAPAEACAPPRVAAAQPAGKPGNPARRSSGRGVSGRAAELPSQQPPLLPRGIACHHQPAPPAGAAGAAEAAAAISGHPQAATASKATRPAQAALPRMPAAAGAAQAAAAPAAKGKWSNFVAAQQQQAAAGQQQQAVSMQQLTLKAALQRGAVASQSAARPPLAGWQQPKQQGGSSMRPAPPAAAAAAAGMGFHACQPPDVQAAAPPGGLFSQFALGSKPAVKSAGPLPTAVAKDASAGKQASQTGVAHHSWLGRGLLSGTAAAAAGMQQGQAGDVMDEAAGKRRRLSEFPMAAAVASAAAPILPASVTLPGTAGPSQPAAAAVPLRPPAAATAPSRTTLNLPKLNFLSAKFAPTTAAPAVPTAAAVPQAAGGSALAVPAAAAPAAGLQQQAPPAATDFSDIFAFL